MEEKVELCIIAAVSINGVIGVGDIIPWKIPSDQQLYKKVTTGNHVIVGGKTYLTLPNVAKQNRTYDILTKNPDYYTNDIANTFTSVDELLNYIQTNEDLKGKVVYVAGGSQVYEQLIDHCDSAIITWVSKTYEGDKHFPINELFNNFDMVNDNNWEKDGNSPMFKTSYYKRSE